MSSLWKYPIEHGIVTDWGDMEKIWHHRPRCSLTSVPWVWAAGASTDDLRYIEESSTTPYADMEWFHILVGFVIYYLLRRRAINRSVKESVVILVAFMLNLFNVFISAVVQAMFYTLILPSWDVAKVILVFMKNLK